MKKIIISMVVISLIFLLPVVKSFLDVTTLTEDVQIELEADVDTRINGLLESELYKHSNLAGREELAYQLLVKLEKEGLIKCSTYSKESNLYSFEYRDGTLGGILLIDFSSAHTDFMTN